MGQEVAVVKAPGSATLQRGVFYNHLPVLGTYRTLPSVEFLLEGLRV